MAYGDCIKRLKKLAPEISEKDLGAAVHDFIGRVKRRAASTGTSEDSAFDQELLNFHANKAHFEQVTKFRALHQKSVLSRMIERNNHFSDPKVGMQAELDGLPYRTKHGQQSADSMIHTQQSNFTGALENGLLEHDLFKQFEDRTMELQIAQALRDEPVNNEAAKSIAKIIDETQEMSRHALNRLGANIGRLKGRIGLQVHQKDLLASPTGHFLEDIGLRAKLMRSERSWSKVRGMIYDMAFERWYKFILPKLDHEKSFESVGPGEEKAYLRNVFDVITGIRQPLHEADLTGRPLNYNALTNLDLARKLHFKSAEDWVSYNKAYGLGTVQKAVIEDLRASGKAYAILDRFGMYPQSAFKEYMRHVLDRMEKMDKYKGKSTVPFVKRWSSVFNYLTDYNQEPVDYMLAKIGSYTRLWTVTTMLGKLFTASIPDVANAGAKLAKNGGNFFTPYHNLLKFFDFSEASQKNQAILGNVLGAWTQLTVGSHIAKFTAIDSPRSLAAQISARFFKWTGAERLDRNNRRGLTLALTHILTAQRHLSFDKIDPHTRAALDGYGIGAHEWDLLRKHPATMYDNKLHLTPDSIDLASDDELKEYALGKLNDGDTDIGLPLQAHKIADEAGRESAMRRILSRGLTDFEAASLRSDLKDRFKSYFADQARFITMQARARTVQLVWAGSRPGTIDGELRRFFGQFKYYTLQYSRSLVYGMAHEAISPDDAALRNSNLGHIVQFAISTSILGYLSYAINSLSEGKSLPNPFSGNLKHDKAIWGEALARGGGLGVIASAWSLAAQSPYQIGANSVFAAYGNLAQAAEFFEIWHRHPGESVGHYLKRQGINNLHYNVPFLNLLYLQPLTTYIFTHELADRMEPGSVARLNQKLQARTGQHYLFSS